MDLSAEKAEKDFVIGNYCYYCEGSASWQTNVFGRYLQEHYNVFFCSTSAYEEYSGRMFQLLNKHFGKNIFKEAVLDDSGQPVRNHLETLDSVEEGRIIREARKK